MLSSKKQIVDERQALIEMYKAGFYDAYSKFNKVKKSEDWVQLNKFYKLAFNKRFGKKITKILKKRKVVK